MVSVSESASITLKMVFETLLREEREEKQQFAGVDTKRLGLRLGVSASQNIAFRLDQVQDGDHVVSFEGVNVLLVDPELNRLIDGCVLDCVDTPASGPRLKLCC